MKLEEIRLLKQSDKSTILLMREVGGNRLFVQKHLKGQHPICEMLRGWSHPYLPRVHEVTISEVETIVLEEYIDGQTLAIAELDAKKARTAALELCDVLGFLHDKRVIHRDIKPSNIILASDGHIRLIDFDAARIIKGEGDQDTQLLGTRNYAPPEQYGFAQTDERTDIYALGVTLREVLGSRAHRFPMGRIIKKCTALNPDKRYPSAATVRRALIRPRYALAGLMGLLIAAAALFFGALPPAPQPPTTDMVAGVKSMDDAYDDMLAEYALVPGLDTDGYSIQDIVGDSRPELIIWGEEGDSRAIFGYDVATGHAYQYQGDTVIQNPQKGYGDHCISAALGDDKASYLVYGPSGWTISKLCLLEVTSTGFSIDGEAVDYDTFRERADRYLKRFPDIAVQYDEDGLRHIVLNAADSTRLNQFLSAFIETGFWQLENQFEDNDQYIDFTYQYLRNKYPEKLDLIEKDGQAYVGIDEETIVQNVKQFFDRDVALSDFGDYVLLNGMLCHPPAQRDYPVCFAQVVNPITYEDGTYHIRFQVYQMRDLYQDQNTLLPHHELYSPKDDWEEREYRLSTALHDVEGRAVLVPRGQGGLEDVYLKQIEVKNNQ